MKFKSVTILWKIVKPRSSINGRPVASAGQQQKTLPSALARRLTRLDEHAMAGTTLRRPFISTGYGLRKM